LYGLERGMNSFKIGVLLLCLAGVAASSSADPVLPLIVEPLNISSGSQGGPKVGLVNDSNVRVRRLPSIQASTLRLLPAMTLVRAYRTEGTGAQENGIWDRWYAITPDGGQWINAEFVDLFPLVLAQPPGPYPVYQLDDHELKLKYPAASSISRLLVTDMARPEGPTLPPDPQAYWWRLENPGSAYSGLWVHGSVATPFIGQRARAMEFCTNAFGLSSRTKGADLTDRFGSLLQTEDVETWQNRYDKNATDRIRRYTFAQGVSVEMLEVSNGGAWWPRRAIARSDQATLLLGLRVGLDREVLLRFLGSPSAVDGTSLSYRHGEALTDWSTKFRVEDGKVTEIEWTYRSGV
jgi:hypothetical protein